MAHDRAYLDNMIGKKVHLILKDGTDIKGIWGKPILRKFGYSIKYKTENIIKGTMPYNSTRLIMDNGLGGISIGYTRDIVISEIKNIELMD